MASWFTKIQLQILFYLEKRKLWFAGMNLENLTGRVFGSTESQPEVNLRLH